MQKGLSWVARPIDDQDVPYQFGVPLETALARRERLADRYDFAFGQERVFPEVVDALLSAIPEGARVLEVGAATGLLTRPLLSRAGHLTALEPSEGMLRRLLSTDVSAAPHLSVRKGMVEDLIHDDMYDLAVVTFTPRRGMGLLALLTLLASHVHERVIMLLDEQETLDWAYVARAAAHQGFDVSLRFVNPPDPQHHRVVLLSAEVANWTPAVTTAEEWDVAARDLEVPYPAPRGAATRLVRYFLASGDRAILVRTERQGVDRLYGNLRTAVHRLGRDEVTVRRVDDGIQIVRLPKSAE